MTSHWEMESKLNQKRITNLQKENKKLRIMLSEYRRQLLYEPTISALEIATEIKQVLNPTNPDVNAARD